MYKMMTLIGLAELRENGLLSKNLCQIISQVKLNLQTSLGEKVKLCQKLRYKQSTDDVIK